MKKVYRYSFSFLLTLAFCLVSFYWVQGQCVPRSNVFHGELLPNGGCGTFTNSGAYGPGEYFRVPVLEGGSYTYSTCGSGIDTQLTGFQGTTTTTHIFHNDDFGPDCPSSTRASINHVSTFTDYVRVNVNQFNCLPGGTQCITVKVRQNNNLTFTSSGADICQGGSRSLTATPARITVTPQAGSGDVGTFSGTGVSGTTFNAPVPTGSSQTINISYSFGYCTTTQSIDVFANPSTANAGPDQTICSASATLGASNPTVGSGTWTITSGPGTVTTPSSPTSTITGLVGGTPTTVTWTVSNGPCTVSTDNVVITREAAPTTSNAGPNQTVCTSSATLAGNTPSVGNGQWTLVGGSGSITTPADPSSGVTGLGFGSNTFRWTISNGGCTASTDDVVITRDAPPTTSNAGPDQTVCGTTATLAGNAASSGTGGWSIISGAANVTTPGDPNSGVTGLSVGANVFVWAITNGGCPPSTDTVTITRFDPPSAASAGPDVSICGSSTTMNATTPGTGTGTWTLIGGSGAITNPNDPNSAVTGLAVGPNTFRWTVTSGPCNSTTDDVVITAAAIPSPPSVSGNTAVCDGSTTTLTASSGPGLTYEWFDADTLGTSLGTNAAFTTPALSSNTSYWVEAIDTASGCTSSRTQVDLTVSAAPAIPVAGADSTTICPNDPIPALTVTVDPGMTADWYDAATGGSIMGMSMTSFTPSAGGTYYVETRDTASGCVSTPRVPVTLVIRPDMVPVFTVNDNNCPDIAFTDGTSGRTPATWAWTFGDGSSSTTQNPTHTYAANGTYTVELTVTDDCGSESVTQTVDITCLVGIEEADALSTPAVITVYPNPNQGIFKVGFENLNAEEIHMQVVDLRGKIVMNRELSGFTGDFHTDVDLSGQGRGLYFIKIYADGKVSTKKVVVQ